MHFIWCKSVKFVSAKCPSGLPWINSRPRAIWCSSVIWPRRAVIHQVKNKGRRALKDNERLFNFWLYSENLASFPSSAVRGFLVQVNHKKHLSFFDEKRPDNQHILGWFYFWYFANCFVLLLQSKISYFTVQMN